MLKYLRVVLACCMGLLFGSVTTPALAVSSSTVITLGQAMTPDKFYYAAGSKYFIVFQSTDGNLVIYKVGTPNNTVLWAAGSFGGTAAVFQQTDGNFVVYNAAGKALWNSGGGKVGGTTGGTMAFYDDGHLEVTNTSNVTFRTPSDPNYGGGTPTCSDHAQQYPVCLFPGTSYQFNSTVLACSVADAANQAAATGARYGRCPGT